MILRNRLTKDENKIYYEADEILSMADAKSFQMYPEESQLGGFGHDYKGLYDPYANKAYTEVDQETFKGFERGYYTDKNAVYTSVKGGLQNIEGANTSTFVYTDWDEKTQSDANDGTHFFIDGEIVK